MTKTSLLLPIPVVFLAVSFFAASKDLQAATVLLPDGSVDGLADAIAAAGPGGTVVVEAGTHYESGTVEIDIPVSIVGESGAVIESATTPDTTAPIQIEPALHIRDTTHVTVAGLELRPDGGAGSCGVFIERTDKAAIFSNTITEYQFGVVVQYGHHAEISDNHISVASLPTGQRHGVVVSNGRFVQVIGNTITNASLALWASDLKGRASRNVFSNSTIGLLLCKVGEVLLGPNGEPIPAEHSATEWHVSNNLTSGNGWGYMASDGSNGNYMVNNAASGNLFHDILLLGDSFFFGFLTPRSYDNVVAAGKHKGLIVKDCGEGNIFSGDIEPVDTSVDVCF